MGKEHLYKITVDWTGNRGDGTSSYRSYDRDHHIKADRKKTVIEGSSDPSFRGDPSRYNPEELFLSSLAACHMLWYLHLCSVNKIVVIKYQDKAEGTMAESENGSGRFKSVILRPNVTVENTSMLEKAFALHHDAHNMCFIANSCNFPVLHEAVVQI